MTDIKYAFKKATRVPPGVTADGVMEERERIISAYGKATVTTVASVVREHPQEYPNLYAFCPQNTEEALRLGFEATVRHVFSHIIQVRVTNNNSGPRSIPTVEVRALHSIYDADGDRVYERIDIIAQKRNLRIQLLTKLSNDIDLFTSKMKNVVAELQEIDLNTQI